MSVLDLRIVTSGPGLAEVRPYVDGVDVIAQADESFPGHDPMFVLSNGALRATEEPREVRLAEAECIEDCCGALYVTIRRDGDEVVWDGWRNPIALDVDLVEARFDAATYDDEIRRVAEDHSWEWPARTVARLLEAELRGRDEHFARWDCALSWVRTLRQDVVDVYFLCPRSAVAEQQWRVDRPWLQFKIEFLVGRDEPAKQAVAFAGLVLAGDPRVMAKVVGGEKETARELGYDWHGPA